jgi:copper transport protein
MKIPRRFVWPVVIALFFSALVVTPVLAHALLVRSNPAANAVLEQAPVQVELFFSEPLEPQLSSINVLDSNGASVDAGDVRVDPADPTRMTVSLRSLKDGVYTVTWKAVSSADGHQTVGTFPFAVGDANAAAVKSIQQSTSYRLPVSALLAKFLMLASLALMLGQRLFIALVWEPVIKFTQVARPAIWARFYHLALIGLMISIGIGLLSLAGQVNGNELTFPWDPQLGHILTETRLGLIWLARVCLVTAAVWLAQGEASSRKDWIAFIVNLGMLLTVSLTSHAAVEAKPLLPILDDWLHMIGMTFWLGGIIYLFTSVRQLQQLDAQQRIQLTSRLTSRFSVCAILFVGLIGITGLYSAYLRVGSEQALRNTLYGHVLLIKQIFVAGLLVIAALNFLVITPRLKRARLQDAPDSGLVARFASILAVDITLAVLLLASVSFLTYIPPAKISSPSTDLTGSSKLNDLSMDISISPGHVGQNTFTLRLASNGRPVASAREVLLRFTPSQANIPPSELELIAQGNGTFSAKGANLSLPSSWQVQAVVRRENEYDAYANFNFKVGTTGTGDETSRFLRINAVMLMLMGLIAGLSLFSFRLQPISRFGTGGLVMVLGMGIGLFYLIQPVNAATGQINPIAPSSESVAAGQAVYEVHCVPCHGETGKGDGPLGVTLNPRPADLTQHAIPGVHTDAQLYEWITNGFPGSAMPAWKTQISDTDRWNLVNFIRTLAPK